MIVSVLKYIKSRFIDFRNKYLDGYATKSYSQEGEDLILSRLLESELNGYYVDIGAHHPKRFSNTYLFYKKGWHGINIDARPGTKELFDKARPNDVNIEVGISNEQCNINYYMFVEPAYNTFDSKIANDRNNSNISRIIKVLNIPCIPLSEILTNYLPNNQPITFMSIDTEGYDIKVLQSNDWNKYRPKYLVVECYNKFIEDVEDSDIFYYLNSIGYKLVSKAHLSLIFEESPHNNYDIINTKAS